MKSKFALLIALVAVMFVLGAVPAMATPEEVANLDGCYGSGTTTCYASWDAPNEDGAIEAYFVARRIGLDRTWSTEGLIPLKTNQTFVQFNVPVGFVGHLQVWRINGTERVLTEVGFVNSRVPTNTISAKVKRRKVSLSGRISDISGKVPAALIIEKWNGKTWSELAPGVKFHSHDGKWTKTWTAPKAGKYRFRAWSDGEYLEEFGYLYYYTFSRKVTIVIK